MANSYRIQDYTEECYCDWCGRLLTVGDRVFPTSDDARVYCADQDRRAGEQALREADTGYRAFEYITAGGQI